MDILLYSLFPANKHIFTIKIKFRLYSKSKKSPVFYSSRNFGWFSYWKQCFSTEIQKIEYSKSKSKLFPFYLHNIFILCVQCSAMRFLFVYYFFYLFAAHFISNCFIVGPIFFLKKFLFIYCRLRYEKCMNIITAFIYILPHLVQHKQIIIKKHLKNSQSSVWKKNKYKQHINILNKAAFAFGKQSIFVFIHSSVFDLVSQREKKYFTNRERIFCLWFLLWILLSFLCNFNAKWLHNNRFMHRINWVNI